MSSTYFSINAVRPILFKSHFLVNTRDCFKDLIFRKKTQRRKEMEKNSHIISLFPPSLWNTNLVDALSEQNRIIWLLFKYNYTIIPFRLTYWVLCVEVDVVCMHQEQVGKPRDLLFNSKGFRLFVHSPILFLRFFHASELYVLFLALFKL